MQKKPRTSPAARQCHTQWNPRRTLSSQAELLSQKHQNTRATDGSKSDSYAAFLQRPLITAHCADCPAGKTRPVFRSKAHFIRKVAEVQLIPHIDCTAQPDTETRRRDGSSKCGATYAALLASWILNARGRNTVNPKHTTTDDAIRNGTVIRGEWRARASSQHGACGLLSQTQQGGATTEDQVRGDSYARADCSGGLIHPRSGVALLSQRKHGGRRQNCSKCAHTRLACTLRSRGAGGALHAQTPGDSTRGSATHTHCSGGWWQWRADSYDCAQQRTPGLHSGSGRHTQWTGGQSVVVVLHSGTRREAGATAQQTGGRSEATSYWMEDSGMAEG